MYNAHQKVYGRPYLTSIWSRLHFVINSHTKELLTAQFINYLLAWNTLLALYTYSTIFSLDYTLIFTRRSLQTGFFSCFKQTWVEVNATEANLSEPCRMQTYAAKMITTSEENRKLSVIIIIFFLEITWFRTWITKKSCSQFRSFTTALTRKSLVLTKIKPPLVQYVYFGPYACLVIRVFCAKCQSLYVTVLHFSC